MFGSVFASFPPLRTEKPPLFFIFSPFSHPSPPFSLLCAELLFVVRAQSNRRRGVAEHHAHACLCALQARSPIPLRHIVSRETIFCAFARANVHCRRWRKRRAKVTSALLLSENCRDLLLFVNHIIFFPMRYLCGLCELCIFALVLLLHRPQVKLYSTEQCKL